MGIVYKAEDLNLKRFVALKFISPNLTLDKNSNDQFIYEAQTASSLDHQNISTIYEIDEKSTGMMFISMAYYNGETLRDKILRGPIPFHESVNIAIQIAEGLSKAHQKGIIHKDIKPANIMIDENGTIKIIDFGLSKLFNKNNFVQSNSPMGTVAYMSPEQIKGKEIHYQTDVWSLGVVLYEMLTNLRPFEGKYDQEVIYEILNENPMPIHSFVDSMPEKIETILAKALSKNLDERYTNMGEFLADLRRFAIKVPGHIISTFKLEEIIKRPIESLAVLPLINLSNDTEHEYFTDGMTDALITSLAKIKILKVISRTSTMRYKTTAKSLPEIAQELNVDAILEGSVLREGNKVQITVQLIHAITDTHIWAETYESDLHDILVLQSNLVKAITKEISITLTQKEEKKIARARAVIPEPYDNYLKGCFHLYKILPDDFDKALEYFNSALKLDPSFARAYTGIAKVWLYRIYWSMSSAKESMPYAKKAVLTALELDDTLEEAHDAMASIKYFYDWDWKGAENEFKKAIELNPNFVNSRLFYSAFLRTMHRDEEAEIQIYKGLELDPISSISQSFFVGHMLHLYQFDEAIIKLREIQKTEPNSPFVHRYLWVAYHQKQNYDKAFEEAKKYFSAVGKIEISDLFALHYSEVGYQSVMQLVADNLVKLSKKSYIQPIWIARLYAYAENKKLSIKWLNIAHKERDQLVVNLGVSRDWENLRGEREFKHLLEKMNLH